LTDISSRKSQYETTFKRWGWRKNLTREEWLSVIGTKRRRELQGKDTEIIIKTDGEIIGVVSSKKIKREEARHSLAELKTCMSCKTALCFGPNSFLIFECRSKSFGRCNDPYASFSLM
jgi:hypothetical protein